MTQREADYLLDVFCDNCHGVNCDGDEVTTPTLFGAAIMGRCGLDRRHNANRKIIATYLREIADALDPEVEDDR